jgi:2-polyprenyl-6-hydroxyphenyl methylase/3-demethylubiquinone-9 3-methyltransferase
MSDAYPEFWNLGPYKYPFYRSKLYSLFQVYVKESSAVLDAGCGDRGGYLFDLPMNVQGIGLDVDRENIKKAAEMAKSLRLDNVSFLVGDIQKMPFHEDVFDVVICCDVLEHVKDAEKAIEGLASALKKDGRLLICTSNAFNPAMFIDGMILKKFSTVIIHALGGTHHYQRTRRFNPWNLVNKLNEYGLKIEKLLMFGYPPIGRPWIYHYSKIKPPFIFHFWITFDKLTKARFLKKFKEEMLIVGKK